jgi:hypothetical protein
MRAKAFLQKLKDKNISDIKKNVGANLPLYEAILKSNLKGMTASNLLGSGKIQACTPPGFIELGDGRITAGGLKLDITTKKTTFTSFDDNWCCLQCGNHGATPAFKIRGLADSSCFRQVVILADQTFPALLPAAGEAQCLRILLIENGSLEALASEFLLLLGNRRVPKGSNILIFSGSHLANVGLETYVADLLKASNKIQAATGKETIVQPLPPIFLGGTTNAELIRSTFELMEWSKEYYGLDDCYLDDGHVTASAILSSQQEGEPRVVDLRRYSLPANKNSSSMRVWASGGEERKALPCSVKALTPTAEKEYLDSLIGELRARQALQLDLEPTLDRVIYRMRTKKLYLKFGG